MATHSSSLAWEIPWTEEPGGLQSMGWQRLRHDWATSPFTHTLEWSWGSDLRSYFFPLNPQIRKQNCLKTGVCLSFSLVWLFVTPWTIACQTPLSVGFSRQEYWSGLSFPSPGGLPNPGIEPGSPTLQADSLPSEPPGSRKDFLKTYLFS